jgi:hypothetical protein
MSKIEARREIAKLAKGDSNWRLAGLMLAHPRVPSGLSEQDVGRAWPVNDSEYRKLGIDRKESPGQQPDKQYAFDEDSAAFRELSGVMEKGAFSSDGPFETKKVHSDRAIKRALAFEDSIANLDTLFREEIIETVIEGARKAKIARDAATVINVDRQRGDHPRGADFEFAPKVAEGGAITDDAGEYDTVEWNTTKHGVGMAATEELLNQSLVDVIAQNMEYLGRQCENAVNRAFITTLVEDAGNDVDTSAEDNRGTASINAGIESVELADFMPDSVVQHPKFTKTLFDTAENNSIIPRANEFGDDEGIRNRVAFPLLGIDGYRASNGMLDPASAETWNFDTAGDTGAVVYDRDNIAIYLYRDIEMKEYDDPIRDLEAINARIEFDVQYHQPDSAAKLNF